jgi:hypothetical protein
MTGAAGQDGLDGIDGATGPTGATGATGATGPVTQTDGVQDNSNVSTSSTSFVLMPGMSITMTTAGGNVEVAFTASVKHSRDQKYSDYALFVDSTEQFRVRTTIARKFVPTGVTLTYLVRNLSAGSHTFEIRWRSEVSNTTVYQWAADWGAGRNLYVVEHP